MSVEIDFNPGDMVRIGPDVGRSLYLFPSMDASIVIDVSRTPQVYRDEFMVCVAVRDNGCTLVLTSRGRLGWTWFTNLVHV